MNGKLIAVAVTAAAALLRGRLLIVTVRGHSMVPTLAEGDRVLVLRRGRTARPRRGGLVVCATPNGFASPGRGDALIIKRVAALAGEPVPGGGRDGAGLVPAGAVYLLGDARDHSTDSRAFGPVSWTDIRGTVIRRLPRTPASAPHSPPPGEGTAPRSARPLP